MTRHAWAGGVILCLTLSACSNPAESAHSAPSADNFHAETFDIRVGEGIQKVNGASVRNAFFSDP